MSVFREFLGQAWMKTDKATRAPHIILMTRRFNEVDNICNNPLSNPTLNKHSKGAQI